MLLQAGRIRAAHLDALIDDIERVLSAVRAQRLAVQEWLDSYKYPVLTLPNEIVSEIFVHFLPVYPKCPPPTGILSPTNLTHICRKWREIALATPALWRAVVLPFNSEIPFNHQAYDTDHWLSRSGSCPMSIEIAEVGTPDWTYELEYEWVPDTLAALNPHRTRWEYLQLNLLTVPFNLFTLEDPMPLIRHLDLQFQEDPDDVHCDPVVLWGGASLALGRHRRARCSKRYFTMGPIDLAIFAGITRRRLFPDLAADVQLGPLRVAAPHTGRRQHNLAQRDSSALRIIDYSRLRRTMGGEGYEKTLTVPALRELHIPERLLDDPLDSLISFISKSGCKLEKMIISGPRYISRAVYKRTFSSVDLSFQVVGNFGRPWSESEYLGEGLDAEDGSADFESTSDVEERR